MTRRALSAVLDEIAKKERHRQWLWCRHWNGFSDQPLWRVAAERLKLPLYQVVAFAHRLDAFANDAGNRGYERGEVSHFSAEEFALALGMPREEAERIFATLEDLGWVLAGHVADFWDRNRDKEDDTAAARQRRKRARDAVLRQLVRLARQGLIEPSYRTDIEVGLKLLPDDGLFALTARLQQALVHSQPVTRDSRRDSVTVTPEQSTNFYNPAVDNAGGAKVAAAGPSDDGVGGSVLPQAGDPQAQALLWIEQEGTRIVTERLQQTRQYAQMRIARWRDQQLAGDAVALMEIIRGADKADYVGARFHNLVVDGIRRWTQKAHPQLPLPPAGLKRTGTAD